MRTLNVYMGYQKPLIWFNKVPSEVFHLLIPFLRCGPFAAFFRRVYKHQQQLLLQQQQQHECQLLSPGRIWGTTNSADLVSGVDQRVNSCLSVSRADSDCKMCVITPVLTSKVILWMKVMQYFASKCPPRLWKAVSSNGCEKQSHCNWFWNMNKVSKVSNVSSWSQSSVLSKYLINVAYCCTFL